MGFGSYDESEQHRGEQQADEDEDDEEAVARRTEADHDGTIEFETGSTDDLLARLDDITDDESTDE